MSILTTDIEGVLIIEPRLFRDARGYFFESFSEREFKKRRPDGGISITRNGWIMLLLGSIRSIMRRCIVNRPSSLQ